VIDLSRPWSYTEASIPIDHRRMVTSLTVLMNNPLQKGELDYAIKLHLSNLADFSSLVEFHWAQRHHIPKEIYLFLRSHCSLRVLKIENEFDVLSEHLLGNLNLPPPQCALTMASIDNYDIMRDLFRRGSASHRTITHLVILDAYLLQALDAEIAFPSLVHLNLRLSFGSLYLPFLFRFLDCNPTLEHITLRALATNPCTKMHVGRLPTLPRLKYFIAETRSNSPFLPLVFNRRMLDTLSLAGALLSGEEIRNISWEGLSVIDIALVDIAAQNALLTILSSNGDMAWRKVTIRVNTMGLWTDNLDVSNTAVSTSFNDSIDSYQGLHEFLRAMANRTTHLTHLHIENLIGFNWDANWQANSMDEEAIHTLHGMAECLNAFPGWVEVKVSSHGGMRFIRFIRRKAGRELSQNFSASGWLGAFEGYDIEIEGWIHGGWV